MKGRIILGALLVSAALAGQGFGFELLNDLLGINQGCSNACCEPACCEKACCEPACCEKNCCEPACCEPCCCKPRCDLFAGLKGLFACKRCCKPCCCEPCGTACCEDVKCCTPEPKCCEKNCCEPACEPNCCEPTCGTCCKPRCTPVRDLIDDLCSLRICIYSVPKCRTCCCEPGCCQDSCGCGGNGAPAMVPKTTPARELPKAPPVDASASVRPNKVYRVSRSVVRN